MPPWCIFRGYVLQICTFLLSLLVVVEQIYLQIQHCPQRLGVYKLYHSYARKSIAQVFHTHKQNFVYFGIGNLVLDNFAIALGFHNAHVTKQS